MTGRVAHGRALPAEVVEQVVAKTDGVPLFVEELIKMVLESGLFQEREDCYALTGLCRHGRFPPHCTTR
jgi:predicted ATPase